MKPRFALLGACVFAPLLSCGEEGPDERVDATAHEIIDGVISARREVLALRVRHPGCDPPGEWLSPVCSAVAISPDAVVTAAHCASGQAVAGLVLALGDDPRAPTSLLPIAGATVHPAYQAALPANDLAVLRLHRPHLDGISPRASQPPAVGASVIVVGFGRTSDGDGAALRHEGAMRVAAVDDLTLRLQPSPAAACHFDSGGAVISDTGHLIAVVRGGDAECTEHTTATRVDAYTSFIDSALAEPVLDGTGEAAAFDSRDSPCTDDRDCPVGSLCDSAVGLCMDPIIGFAGYLGGEACRQDGDCASEACLRTAWDSGECACYAPSGSAAGDLHGYVSCSVARAGGEGRWVLVLLALGAAGPRLVSSRRRRGAGRTSEAPRRGESQRPRVVRHGLEER